ncbi:MAG: hypothetical protein II381_02470 [Victivallales bacterium]|nr:hypothetical protein [Victivallales bacterium]
MTQSIGNRPIGTGNAVLQKRAFFSGGQKQYRHAHGRGYFGIIIGLLFIFRKNARVWQFQIYAEHRFIPAETEHIALEAVSAGKTRKTLSSLESFEFRAKVVHDANSL